MSLQVMTQVDRRDANNASARTTCICMRMYVREGDAYSQACAGAVYRGRSEWLSEIEYVISVMFLV